MEEFTKELLEQLNVNTAFTIGPFAISESVVITWVVMAILVLLSAWLTRGLKVHNPGKKQIVAENIVIWLDRFTISMLGENAKEYSTYISTILLYIGLSNIIGIFGMNPPTKDRNPKFENNVRLLQNVVSSKPSLLAVRSSQSVDTA